MNKTTLALLGVLAALSLIAYLLMQRPGEQSTTGSEGETFLALDSAAVERIEIQSPASSVVLEKRGAEWHLTEPMEKRADQAKVAAMVKNLKELRIGAVVSSNPEKQSLFQVDSTGTVIRIREAGVEPKVFVLGKMGSDFSEAYARKENSEEVVTIGTAISYDVRRTPNDWRDHAIVSVPKESMTRVEFRYGDTTFVLSRNDTAWAIDGITAKAETVNSLLTSLASLQCDSFLDDPPGRGHRLVATISFSGVQISFFRKQGSESYAVQTSVTPQWYELRSWRVDQVLKRKKDLLPL